jgi:hypothetical protein
MRHLARSAVRAAVLTVATAGILGIMGMGGFGGGKEAGPPAREFRATFTDADGQTMQASAVTAGGDTSLEGELGRGRLRVPFDNIARIGFQPTPNERDRVRAEVRLREGEPIVLTLRSSTTFYGRVPGGSYQIRARDLQAVEFVQ